MIIHIGQIDDKELWVKLRHFQSGDFWNTTVCFVNISCNKV